MSYLNQFGIAIDGGQVEVAMAMDITDEIAISLMQQGIDVASINKLSVPTGFTNVGQMTILCYLPTDIDWRNEELWAIVGPCKWRLSNHYRIHRVFAQPSHGEPGVGDRQTLSVISIDDWRYNLNIHGSNNTNKKTDNSYKDDFTITDDGLDNESDAEVPYEVGDFGGPYYHLFFDYSWVKSLENPFNVWGYERKLSDAELADRILTSCGMVACPQLQFREEASTEITYNSGYLFGSDINGNNSPQPAPYNPETHWMVAEYIGDGHLCASQLWENLYGYYVSGQLECAFGNFVDNQNDFEVEDDMIEVLDDIPQSPPNAQDIWIARPEDGNQEIPETVEIQFPAKTPDGRYVLYTVKNVEHGKPDYNSNFSETVESKVLTDHIKTKTSSEIPDDLLEEHGLTIIQIDPFEQSEVPGLSEDRVRDLLRRALHISRSFYARYYSCSGVGVFAGWHHVRAISGVSLLEYGFSMGKPFTKIQGEKHNELFGFKSTDFSSTSMVTGGGLLLNRPDGQTEVIAGGAGVPSDLLWKITGVGYQDMEQMCFPKYSIERVSGEGTYENLIPTDREVPNMCYEAINVGDPVLFAFVPTPGYDDDEPEEPSCNPGGCNYILIAGEQVQTKECQ